MTYPETTLTFLDSRAVALTVDAAMKIEEVMSSKKKNTFESSVAEASVNGGWHPYTGLDLKTANNKAFLDYLDRFKEWAKAQPVGDEVIADGWHEITPETAERWLIRNSANRKPSFSHVAYLARQMVKRDWPKTGQAIIFNKDGRLIDGGHRLNAGYLSGSTFWSYVITLPEDVPAIFAYLDNSKSRTPKDALEAGDYDGQAPMIAKTVLMVMSHEAGCFTASKTHRLEKPSNKEVFDFAEDHQNIRRACYRMTGEFAGATDILQSKDVAGALAFEILELYDEFVLRDFMEELMTEALPAGSPALALRDEIEKDLRRKEPQLRGHHVFGLAVKAFNAWVRGEEVRALKLSVNDDFPTIVLPVVEAPKVAESEPVAANEPQPEPAE